MVSGGAIEAPPAENITRSQRTALDQPGGGVEPSRHFQNNADFSPRALSPPEHPTRRLFREIPPPPGEKSRGLHFPCRVPAEEYDLVGMGELFQSQSHPTPWPHPTPWLSGHKSNPALQTRFMKLKNTALAALTCAALIGSAALSQADVLVSETFDYDDGPLDGQNGGIGFNGAWTSTTNVTSGVVEGNAPSFRLFSSPFGSSGTLWVSFDWGNSAAPTQNEAYGGLTFYAGAVDSGFTEGPGGTERFLIGNTWEPIEDFDVWRMSGSGPTMELNYPSMKTAVARITLGTGATSTVELWVGPTGSPVDVSGAAMATSTGRNLEGLDGIRIMGQDFGSGGSTQRFANLVIGTTAADVGATDSPSAPITATWSNPAGGEWGAEGNWLANVVATGSGSTADFSTLDITADTTVNLDSARTIGNLVFGDTDTSTAAGWTLANNAVAGNHLNLVGTSPTITVNTLGDTKAVTISAVVAGSAGLAKSGTGTLILSGANTYSGLTTVNDGTLQVSGQPYFNVGRTTTVASGAVFELHNSNNTFTTLMPVSTVTGAGTFRLSGDSTINQSLNGTSGTRLTFAMDSGGLIDLQDSSILKNGGWQELNWTSNLADMNIASGATFDLWDGQNVTINALTGSGTIDKKHPGNSPTFLTVGVDHGSGTFGGTITNTQSLLTLVKTGSGTQTFSGANSYTGNTTVENGTLNIASSGSLRFRPTTYGQTNSLGGSVSASLSYLGTVDLDLSAADTTDGNLWNIVNLSSFGGPIATLNPVAVTSTFGSFSETTTGSGIWELTTPGAKWTFDEAYGTLFYQITATDYDTWAASFGLVGGPDGDDDNDGLTNFEEYAFGLIPNSGASVNPIAVPLDNSTRTFSYTRRATPASTGLSYSVWFSTDLAGWTEDTAATEGTPSLSGEVETVPVTLSELPGNPLPAKLFIQVRAN